jgi:hypothetical protein
MKERRKESNFVLHRKDTVFLLERPIGECFTGKWSLFINCLELVNTLGGKMPSF